MVNGILTNRESSILSEILRSHRLRKQEGCDMGVSFFHCSRSFLYPARMHRISSMRRIPSKTRISGYVALWIKR